MVQWFMVHGGECTSGAGAGSGAVAVALAVAGADAISGAGAGVCALTSLGRTSSAMSKLLAPQLLHPGHGVGVAGAYEGAQGGQGGKVAVGHHQGEG